MTAAVLLVHERPSVAQIAARVLEIHGYEVQIEATAADARVALGQRRWDALVTDVSLPDAGGFELVADAKSRTDSGARYAVLIASVYRKTRYKRRPTSLYGADDYVEIHHVCDHLPQRLAALLGQGPGAGEQTREARALLDAEGDARLGSMTPERLAAVIAADVVLYNGAEIKAAVSIEGARAAVSADLEVAEVLWRQVLEAEGREVPEGDLVVDAFCEHLRSVERAPGGRTATPASEGQRG